MNQALIIYGMIAVFYLGTLLLNLYILQETLFEALKYAHFSLSFHLRLCGLLCAALIVRLIILRKIISKYIAWLMAAAVGLITSLEAIAHEASILTWIIIAIMLAIHIWGAILVGKIKLS